MVDDTRAALNHASPYMDSFHCKKYDPRHKRRRTKAPLNSSNSSNFDLLPEPWLPQLFVFDAEDKTNQLKKIPRFVIVRHFPEREPQESLTVPRNRHPGILKLR